MIVSKSKFEKRNSKIQISGNWDYQSCEEEKRHGGKFGEKLRAIAHPRKLEASEVIDVEVEATAEDEESLVIETPDLKSRQVKLYASFRFLNFQFCFILTFYSYKSWPADS